MFPKSNGDVGRPCGFFVGSYSKSDGCLLAFIGEEQNG